MVRRIARIQGYRLGACCPVAGGDARKEQRQHRQSSGAADAIDAQVCCWFLKFAGGPRRARRLRQGIGGFSSKRIGRLHSRSQMPPLRRRCAMKMPAALCVRAVPDASVARLLDDGASATSQRKLTVFRQPPVPWCAEIVIT